MDYDLTNFGENVMEVMIEKDVNQKELADMAGYHRNRIYQLLRTKNPNKRTVMRIAKVLKVRPSRLVESREGNAA